MADALSNVNVNSNVNELWVEYKKIHKKSYSDQIEENERFQIFVETVKTIIEHNAKFEKGETSYSMGINHFADLRPEERSRYTGGVRKPTS